VTIQVLTFDLDNTLWETDPVIVRAEQASYHKLCTSAPALPTCTR
jgi:FMN phosphatase YigB (HAD superfamily)